MRTIPPLALLALAACNPVETEKNSPSAVQMAAAREGTQDVFFSNIAALCGKSYAGEVVSPPTDADADFVGKPLVMHIRDCSEDVIRIPFHVGDDRSRTWVITRTDAGLRLKHDHRHADGSKDVLTQYGGDTMAQGTATRQEFPVDQFSKDLFNRQEASVSTTNVWAIEVFPARLFAYELRRPNRFFRVEFDLTKTVPTPPPAWGAE